jgi:hypothetical protein
MQETEAGERLEADSACVGAVAEDWGGVEGAGECYGSGRGCRR